MRFPSLPGRLAVFALSGLAVAALTMSATSAAAAVAKTSVAARAAPVAAPLTWTRRVLANGLQVYAQRDDASPSVSVQVWYRVGSKDDPAGRSGFAHLFEHLMFKATRNMPPETLDRLTEDVGGENNASTADDYTEYHETAPANHLERLLWAEAERMGSLVIDEANFRSERDVVKEELRQRVLAQPYGKLFALYLPWISFQTSPYGRPGIGSIEDLDAATVQDVRAFHATYYRPDNAVLVVTGRFEPAQLDRWIDRYFAPIRRPDRPIPRVEALERPRAKPVVWTAYEPNTPLPAVLLSYPGPTATTRDLAALIVMDAILSKGESARLHHDLVYTQQVAQETFTFLQPGAQPGAYAVGAILSSGQNAEAGERALLKTIEGLRRAAPSTVEVEAARNQIITDTLRSRETVAGRGAELAQAVVVYGDAGRADSLLAELARVTPADVRQAARRWLDPERRAVVRYLSDAARPGNAPVHGVAATVRTRPLTPPADIAVFSLAPEAERQAPPAPGPSAAARAPDAVERTLPNGLRVIVAPDHDLPLVSAVLTVSAGGAQDPADRAGAASMTAELLTKGAGRRTATDIARQIEALGGTIDTDAGADLSSVSLVIKKDRLSPALEIFADVALRPTFAPEELERSRAQALNGLEVALSNPGALAGYAMARALYGSAPYGAPLSGSPASLRALTAADVRAFHARWWRPERAVLVFAGDIDPEAAVRLATERFGGWAAGQASASDPIDPAGPATAARVIVVDLPGAGQAAVAVGRRGLARSDPRYFPAVVANTILGGGYSARLNQEIRIRRGLSYGARSSMAFRLRPGPFVASTQTKNASAPEVVDIILAELRRLGAEPVGEAELQARKQVVIGGFGRTIETNESTAALLAGLAQYGVSNAEIGAYASRVEAVSAGDVARVAAEVLSGEGVSVVVAGDAAQFLPALKSRFPALEVVKASDLDLDRATLIRAP